MSTMTLFHSPASPFVRKVMVLLHESGQTERVALHEVQLSPVAPSAAYKSEWVSFPALEEFNGRPVKLDGLLYRPAGKGPFPALMLMHGCSGMFASNGEVTQSYLHWAELLA